MVFNDNKTIEMMKIVGYINNVLRKCQFSAYLVFFSTSCLQMTKTLKKVFYHGMASKEGNLNPFFSLMYVHMLDIGQQNSSNEDIKQN